MTGGDFCSAWCRDEYERPPGQGTQRIRQLEAQVASHRAALNLLRGKNAELALALHAAENGVANLRAECEELDNSLLRKLRSIAGDSGRKSETSVDSPMD